MPIAAAADLLVSHPQAYAGDAQKRRQREERMPNDMANRGWRTVAQMGSTAPQSTLATAPATTCAAALTLQDAASDYSRFPLLMPEYFDRPAGGSNLRERLQPVAAASASATAARTRDSPGVSLEAVELPIPLRCHRRHPRAERQNS